MIMLIEIHKEKLRQLRKRTLAAYGLFVLLFVLSLGCIVQARNENARLEAERDLWAGEAKSLMGKFEALKVLGPKPMTIGQAMEVLDAIANQRKVPISVVLAVIDQESEFYPQARSDVGARSLTQIMPATIKFYIKDPMLRKQIDRPSVNVTGGLMHLAYLKSTLGTWERSLREYFGGDGQADNKKFDWYAKAVLRKATKYQYLE
jgi:hypothetical protein